MDYDIEFDDEALTRGLADMCEQTARSRLEQTIIDAIGHEGFRQLTVSYDLSRRPSVHVSIAGPQDLAAKVRRAFKSKYGSDLV
jgi:hypothetical protein